MRTLFRWQTCLVCGALVAASFASYHWGRNTAAGTSRPNGEEPSEILTITKSRENGRVLAYVFKDRPIYRDEYGDFLIDRVGFDRLEFFVKQKLVDDECIPKNIHITEPEINAQLNEDLKAFGRPLSEKDFERSILQKYNKTLREYKDDVIRPRLQLIRLLAPTIEVTEAEVKQIFDSKYGPRVDGRMIVFQPNDKNRFDIREKVKNDESQFSHFARNQFVPKLAAEGGRIPAIYMNFPDARIEKEAFSLQEGEVSAIIDMPDGTHLIFKCDKKRPADIERKLQDERVTLSEELRQIKLARRIPEYMEELWRNAAPNILVRQNDPRPQPNPETFAPTKVQ